MYQLRAEVLGEEETQEQEVAKHDTRKKASREQKEQKWVQGRPWAR